MAGLNCPSDVEFLEVDVIDQMVTVIKTVQVAKLRRLVKRMMHAACSQEQHSVTATNLKE
jgi:hypothetical protein